MYTVYADDKLMYAPGLENDGYGVMSPVIAMGLNEVHSFSFILPPNNIMYDKLKKLKTIITVYKDDEEIFCGRILHDEKDFYKRKKIYCESELAYLNDSVQKPYSFSGNVKQLFEKMISNHNEQVEEEKQYVVGVVDVEDEVVEQPIVKYEYVPLTSKPEDWDTNWYNYYIKLPFFYYQLHSLVAPFFVANKYYKLVASSETETKTTKTEKSNSEYQKTNEAIKSALISEFGGYIKIRKVNGKRYIDYLKEYGKQNSQVIEFGKSILDLSEYISAENIYTCLIPTGKEVDGVKTTIESVNSGRDYISDATAINLFGKIWNHKEWSDIDSPVKLKKKAEEDLKNNIKMSVSLKVSALDLNLVDVDIEKIRLGDRIRVLSPPHDLDAYFLCSKITLDLVQPDKSIYELGISINALTEKQIDDKKMTENKMLVLKGLTNTAQTTADNAQISANEAQISADDAQKSADDAQISADNAQKSADNSQKSADNAQKTADSAKNSADNAQKSADNAQKSSDNAQKSADEALKKIVSMVEQLIEQGIEIVF